MISDFLFDVMDNKGLLVWMLLNLLKVFDSISYFILLQKLR